MDNCNVSSKQRDSSPPEKIILSSFIHPHVVLNLTFFCLWNIKEDILGNLGEFFCQYKANDDKTSCYPHFSKYVLYSIKDSQQLFYYWFHADAWEESLKDKNTTNYLIVLLLLDTISRWLLYFILHSFNFFFIIPLVILIYNYYKLIN